MNKPADVESGPASVGFGPVLSGPFVAYQAPDADFVGTPFPWPHADHSFRFSSFNDFFGAYLAPSHWVARQYPAVDLRTPAPLRLGDPLVQVSGLADGEALYRVLTWGSVPGPDGVALAPSLAWLVRVLSVVHWAACPRDMASLAQGTLPVTGARLMARLVVCPGSNLDALVALAWRVMRDVSVVLGPALEDASRNGAGSYALCSPAVESALRGLGPVPGHPLMDWSDVLTSDALLQPYPAYFWGTMSLGAIAARAVKRVSALPVRLTAQNAPRAFRFNSFGTFDQKVNWDRTLGHNLGVYSAVCARLVTETLYALRVVSHIVHLLRLFHVHRVDAAKYRPARWVATLRTLAEADMRVLDSLLFQLARDASLPLPWLWYAERDLESFVVRVAPSALQELWAIPTNSPDSLDRAGASCPENGRYFAPYEVPSA